MDMDALASADWLTLKVALGVCAGMVAAHYLMRIGDRRSDAELSFGEILFGGGLALMLLLALGWPLYSQLLAMLFS